MILATSFILDLRDEKPGAVRKAREIDARGEPICLPTPVLYELWEGVARSERPRQEATKIQTFVSGHDVLPFSDADARETGLLPGRLSRGGRIMGTTDVRVAGMPKARGQLLLIADRRFRDLATEIRLERYP